MNDSESSTTTSNLSSNRSFNLNTSICDDYACTADFQKRRSRSLVCVSHNTRLKSDIDGLKSLLKEKDDIIVKLIDVRERLESEVRELSASLFEQAYAMVNKAKEETAHSNKLLKETQNKCDILEAEVKALKELVLTSTPSTPNRHLHPQLMNGSSITSVITPRITPTNTLSHKRTSSYDCQSSKSINTISIGEIDPVYFKEMAEWLCDRQNASLPFINRVLDEDIRPCMNYFMNKQLSNELLKAIQVNCVCIEEISNNTQLDQTQICSLSCIPCICQYKIKLNEQSKQWYFISKLCRNRITSICDFYAYLRYVKDGLVKSENQDIYWTIIDLRKRISTSRLGL